VLLFELAVVEGRFVLVGSGDYVAIRFTNFIYLPPVEKLCLIVVRDSLHINGGRDLLSNSEDEGAV